jgi:hypothetical protein
LARNAGIVVKPGGHITKDVGVFLVYTTPFEDEYVVLLLLTLILVKFEQF